MSKTDKLLEAYNLLKDYCEGQKIVKNAYF